jgi:MFS family permease
MTEFKTPSMAMPSAESESVGVLRNLLPIVVAIFICFLMVGMSLPVIPLHVHATLGYGPLVVGIIVGGQFLASLLSRPWAGAIADTRGAKAAVVTGFVAAAGSGLLYLASLAAIGVPLLSLVIVMAGRILLGCAESLVATGALAWGIARVGPAHAGSVMVWVGNAIFAAWALGAPLGAALYGWEGFAAVGLAAALIPLLALAILRNVVGSVATSGRRAAFFAVVRSVWMPGLGLAFTSTGFGVITTFIALLFVNHGWTGASLAFTAFGAAFIGARLLFGGLPDKLGGARVALVVVAVGALGQFVIWSATSPVLVYLGAALTGAGYSLAFPAFGVEAVRRAPAQARGTAMGAYVVFLDIALGLTGPLAGTLAGHAGYAAVYLAAGCTMLLGVVVAWRLLVHPPSQS